MTRGIKGGARRVMQLPRVKIAPIMHDGSEAYGRVTSVGVGEGWLGGEVSGWWQEAL